MAEMIEEPGQNDWEAKDKEEIDKFIKELERDRLRREEAWRRMPRDVWEATKDAASFGFSPQITGFESGVKAKLSGKDYLPAYQQSRDAIREERRRREARNPAAGFYGGAIAGAVQAGPRVAAKAGPPLIEALKDGSLVGVQSALAGLGYGEPKTWDEALAIIAANGGIGALVGGSFSAAGRSMGKLTRERGMPVQKGGPTELADELGAATRGRAATYEKPEMGGGNIRETLSELKKKTTTATPGKVVDPAAARRSALEARARIAAREEAALRQKADDLSNRPFNVTPETIDQMKFELGIIQKAKRELEATGQKLPDDLMAEGNRLNKIIKEREAVRRQEIKAADAEQIRLLQREQALRNAPEGAVDGPTPQGYQMSPTDRADDALVAQGQFAAQKMRDFEARIAAAKTPKERQMILAQSVREVPAGDAELKQLMIDTVKAAEERAAVQTTAAASASNALKDRMDRLDAIRGMKVQGDVRSSIQKQIDELEAPYQEISFSTSQRGFDIAKKLREGKPLTAEETRIANEYVMGVNQGRTLPKSQATQTLRDVGNQALDFAGNAVITTATTGALGALGGSTTDSPYGTVLGGALGAALGPALGKGVRLGRSQPQPLPLRQVGEPPIPNRPNRLGRAAANVMERSPYALTSAYTLGSEANRYPEEKYLNEIWFSDESELDKTPVLRDILLQTDSKAREKAKKTDTQLQRTYDEAGREYILMDDGSKIYID